MIVPAAKLPAAIGPYSLCRAAGDLVFLSGQLGGDVDGNLPVTVEEQAANSLANIAAILATEGLGFADVVKTTIFLTDLGDFAAVNQIYADAFPDGAYPARSCVQVAALPKDALVEIEVIAHRP